MPSLHVGDVALFYFSFSQGQRLMRSLLSDVGQTYYNILFLRESIRVLNDLLGLRDCADRMPMAFAEQGDLFPAALCHVLPAS